MLSRWTIRIAAALVMALLLIQPETVAAASGEGGSAWGWLETAGRWFNLLVLVGGIIYLARQPLVRFFKERGSGIRLQMEEAAKARAEARDKLEQIEARLGNLDQELEAIRKESQREAELEKKRIIAQAKEEAEKIVALAGREIDGLSQAARKDLQSYAAQLAVELAEKQISREMGEADRGRLVKSFVSGLRERGVNQ